MVKDELTQDELKELLEYNPDTGLWKWHTPKGNAKEGWFRGSRGTRDYRVIKIQGKSYKAHRLAFLFMEGALPPALVDHVDGNTANNRWNNLRHCCYSENNLNKRLYSTNSSGHKGVAWREDSRKWQVRVSVAGRQRKFGCYKDLELAALVAEEAREKYHGEFANHGNS